ncbi:MAG: PLP-dependent aspartate aminotransferase family protein [Gammaproteobacteria bacterium]|nr:PLP-dependent aspartate aminotransferase family protein [Gammaproteobacteria bacterium]
MPEDSKEHVATLLASAGHCIDQHSGGVSPTIELSTTYARDSRYEHRLPGLSYSRDANPTYRPAETLLARLETGEDALLFSSGLAAATAIFKSLRSGDHVVAPKIMYHGLRDFLNAHCERFGIRLDYFDAREPDGLSRAVRPGETKIVWIETPCNPTWDVTDISGAAEIAHAAGARLAVDSTVATPVLTRPIEHGADLVMHSATKYLNGHGDVVAGALVCRKADPLWDAIRFERKHGGAVLGPFEAWLLLRGMRTLWIRVEKSCDNALAVARYLESHPAVERVLYPGLASHPGHELAKRQMRGGFGGMLSMLVKGDAETARAVATRTRVFVPATSLGGVESLIEHRASVEGPASPIPPNLLRLSLGIEEKTDLIADLEAALAAVPR